MAKCDVFQTYNSGNLPTLTISLIAPTILMKLSPHLSWMRSAGAVVGWGKDTEKDLGRQVNPFMPVRRREFSRNSQMLNNTIVQIPYPERHPNQTTNMESTLANSFMLLS